MQNTDKSISIFSENNWSNYSYIVFKSVSIYLFIENDNSNPTLFSNPYMRSPDIFIEF